MTTETWIVVGVALYLVIGNAVWHYIKDQVTLPEYSPAMVVFMRLMATTLWLFILVWMILKGK